MASRSSRQSGAAPSAPDFEAVADELYGLPEKEFTAARTGYEKQARRAGDTELATSLEVAAAENLKRVRRAPAAEPDWSLDPDLGAMTAFLETKTVWHPIGV